MIPEGCGTALLTPFRPDGAVDEPALNSLVHRQIDAGVRFLVPCGSTGEAATLTEAETARVVQIVCATAAGRVPVFAGCTHNATHEAISRARRLAQIHGLTGLLTASPYYNRPNQEGQYQHFKAIAAAVDLPILLYNVPSRTGANLEPATVLRLSHLPNIIGLKESSGNLAQITELLTTLPSRFLIFAGDDGLALPILALGAAGLISVAANVIPTPIAQLTQAALQGDWTTARRLNRQYYRFMQSLFLEPSPAPVKAIFQMLDHGSETLRLPLVPITKSTRHTLETLSGELGLFVKAAPRESNLRVF